jgi:type VI secretion system protein ImpF
MAEASARDTLQPALLDRLLDDAPQQQVESREDRVITRQRLRACVLRDLGWLFNTTAPSVNVQVGEQTRALGEWQYVRDSVLNYGLPALSGRLVSSLDLTELERAMREAILAYEPRILPDTLQVTGIRPEDPHRHHNVITMQISGQLWAQPYPLELLIKTDLNLESGEVKLAEGS